MLKNIFLERHNVLTDMINVKQHISYEDIYFVQHFTLDDTILFYNTIIYTT